LREFALQLEERHSEKGRPEYSRWNRCGMIVEDMISDEARVNLKESMDAYIANGMAMSTEVAEIKISLAKLFKRDHDNTTGHF
jgi:hypothetical protein